MKNRKLILILSLVLALTMSLGGTLAYLTDTDSEVNTMTLGNVDIENREYERRDEDNDGKYDTITTARGEGYKLYEYSDAKPLLPAVGKITGYDSTRVFFEQFGEGHEKGAMDVFDNDEFKNVQDKFVFVENTGKTDAFVRTYIAYEVGNYVSDEGKDAFSDGLIMVGMNTAWKAVDIGLAEINGNNYFIVEYNYDGNFYNEKMTAVTDVNGRHPDGIVHPGEYTYNNLAQVYLAGRATNEDMVAIDGNANGTLDILVLSQAIQANGFADMYAAFDEGFPKGDDAAATVAAWFEGEESTSKLPVVIKNTEELEQAIADGETNLVLIGEGPFVLPNSAQGKTLTISGDGSSVIATKSSGSYEGCNYALDGSTVTFKNITINTTSTTYVGYARCKATYENCTINGTYTLYDNSTFDNCTFNVTGDVYNIWTWGAPVATFKNCTFNSDGKAMLLYGQANTKLTMNNCVFNDNGGLTDLKAAIEIGNDYNTSYELIVNNTTVNGYEINDKGISTGTTLWGNKNSMGTDKLNVVVDGVDVY